MRRSLGWWLPVLALASWFGVCGARAVEAEAPRLALVIGNAGYPTRPLSGAANDAGLIAQTLAQDGFDVTAMRDVDAATLRGTTAAFLDKLRAAGGEAVVVVYLSGYGVQYAGDNFFVPVDAKIDRQADVPGAAVALQEIAGAIEARPARARLFVYDLARENPMAAAATGPGGLPLAPGLALTHAPPGSLYAYNAAPGMIARSDVPPYGLYARALAEMMRTPGLSAQTLFARVRLRVAEITSGVVVPWDDTNLDPDFALVAGDVPPVKAEERSIAGLSLEPAYWRAIAEDRLETYQAFVHAFPGDGLAVRVGAMIATRLEAATWRDAVRADRPAAYWTYMQRYARGPHYVDVRRRLAALHAALEPPSRFDLQAFPDDPAPSPDQIRAMDRPDFSPDDPDGLPSPRLPDDVLPPPAAALYVDLAPPPLVPRGVLPIPFPIVAGHSPAGRIDQPFVPGLGAVSIAGDKALILSTNDGLVSRTTLVVEKGRRTILQTDAANEIVSQTAVARPDGSLTTITQTGPDGGLLSKVVTQSDPLGERSTIVTDGQGVLVAEVQADRRGVVTEVRRGTASLDDTTFLLPVSDHLPVLPKLDVAKPVVAKPAVPKPVVSDPAVPQLAPNPPAPLVAPPPIVPGTPASPPPPPPKAEEPAPQTVKDVAPLPVPRPNALKARHGAAHPGR